MLKGMVDSIATGLASGGTVDGDLVVTGDFKVEGAGSFAFDEIVEGTLQVNATGTASQALKLIGQSSQVSIGLQPDSGSTTHSIVAVSNILSFRPQGTSVLNVLSTGRVGINTTSPSDPLHVVGNAKITGLLSFNGASYIQDVSNNYLKLRIANGDYFAIHGGASDTEYFRLTDDGKIGIGTSSPSHPLHINSNVSNGQLLQLHNTNTGDGTFIKFTGAHSTSEDWQIGSGTLGYYIYNLTDSSMGLMVSNAGNVGIGTSSPLAKLNVDISSNAVGILVNATDSNDSIMQFTNSTTGTGTSDGFEVGLEYSEDAVLRLWETGKKILFKTGGDNTRMAIDDSGRVGIGTDSPSNKLHIFDGTYNLLFDGNEINHSDANDFFIKSGGSIKFQPSATTRFVLDSNSRISLSNNDSGTQNSVFGSSAGNALASGSQGNSSFGHESLLNTSTGDRNTALGYQSLRHNSTGSNNVAVGYEALRASSGNSTSNNVALGNYTMYSLSTGGTNVAVGGSALYHNGSGNYNTAIGVESMQGASGQSHSNNTSVGYKSLYSITTASASVAVGKEALYSTTTGGSNTALGHQAMYYGTESDSNVAVGQSALEKNVTGDDNTALGYQSQYGASGQSHSTNTSVGYQSLKNITTGSSNVAAGANSLQSNTTGTGNVSLGQEAMYGGNRSGDIAIGQQAMYQAPTGGLNYAIGRYALMDANAGTDSLSSTTNIAIGQSALGGTWANVASSYNIAIGHYSMDASMNGAITNIAVGHYTLSDLTEGDSNSVLGYNAGNSITSGGTNILIGRNAGSSATAMNSAVIIGTFAGDAINTSNSNGSVLIGYQAGTDQTAGINTFIGYDSGRHNGSGTYNTALGYNSMKGVSGNSFSSNTAIGYESLKGITTGGTNVALGADSAFSLTTQSTNVIIGAASGYSIAGSNSIENVIIGGYAGTGGSGDLKRVIAIGKNALNSTGANDITGAVAIGYNSLTALTTGSQNIAIGFEAGRTLSSGSNNTFLGYEAGEDTTGGSSNTYLGNFAGGNHTGSYNTFVGDISGSGASGGSASGSQNTALGYTTLHNLTSGANNVAIGSQSGKLMTTASGATSIGALSLDANVSGGEVVAIGYQALSFESFAGQVVAVGYEALKSQNKAANSYNTAIGSQVGRNVSNGEHNNLSGYRAGETLTTGDENILIGSSSDVSTADAQNQIVIGKGATGVQNNSAIIGNSSCADVFMGDNGSAWSTTSDGRLKENVEDWNVGLDAINNLRIVSYNFKKNNPYKYNSDKKRQGIIAQEAQKVLPEMIKDDGEWLSANQEPMIWALVNAVQELSTQVNNLKKQLKDK